MRRMGRAEAIEHALGISASVTALALQAEQLAAKPPRPEHHRTYSPNGPSRRWSFKRRNDSSLYRGKLAIQSESAKALAERGGEWAELAELARQHGIALPNKNLDWLAPYRRMVELERERLAE